MGDWDSANPTTPNGHLLHDKKIPQLDFDNPAFREDIYSVPTSYRKNVRTRPEPNTNHLIFDVSKHKQAAINNNNNNNDERKHRYHSGSSGRSLVIRKSADNFGSNRYSEPVVLNTGHLDRHRATARKHHTLGKSAGNVYYTKSRKSLKKLHPTGFSTFKRHTGSDRKTSCISFFDIEKEKVDTYQYRPGEEVCGSLNIIIKENIEIRYVELQVIGEGVLTLRNSRDGLPKTAKEIYLKKSTCVIGSADAAWTSLLTPGHYTSKFRIKLPVGLPSSQIHDDPNNGFTYKVNYTLLARICDDVTPTSSSRGSTHQGRIKAIISKKATFQVERNFDLNTIPGAQSPLTKTETIFLSCAHREPATVSVTVERIVFLAGDDIRLQLAASLPASQQVKEINCRLQEHLTFSPKHERMTFTIAKVTVNEPREILSREGHKDVFELAIPSQTDLISSFGVGKGHMKISYTLDISLRFKPAGGKLLFKIPIGIGPCAEPIYGEKTSTKKIIPVFNRPTRFPHFSPTPQNNASNSSTPREQSSNSETFSSSVPVISKYSNSVLARCFLCCRGISNED